MSSRDGVPDISTMVRIKSRHSSASYPLEPLILRTLWQLADEVRHSDIVYTFMHPLLRDQQEDSINTKKLKGERPGAGSAVRGLS